jgi:hypothetical protein
MKRTKEGKNAQHSLKSHENETRKLSSTLFLFAAMKCDNGTFLLSFLSRVPLDCRKSRDRNGAKVPDAAAERQWSLD